MAAPPSHHGPTTAVNAAVRAALLARVSTDHQVQDGTGLDVQLDKGREVIERNGWTPAGEFVDEGESGTVLDRPAVRKLLAACSAGQVQVVVMTSVSRMARDEVVDAQLRKVLYDAGVAVCLDGQVFQLTKEGMFNLGVLGLVAAYQHRDLIEQMARGQHQRAKQGGWPGGQTPYGIRLDYPPREDGGKPLAVPVEDEREAECIRVAYDLIVNRGYTTWTAASELNARGYRPRQSPRWIHNSLRRILASPSLKGEMTWAKRERIGKGTRAHVTKGRYGQPVAVSIPAILTDDEWSVLQAALATTATPTPRRADEPYLLSGRNHQHLWMPCGAAAHGVWDRRPGRKRQYRCANLRPEAIDRCDCNRVDADLIEELVTTWLMSLLANPDLLDTAVERWLSGSSESSPVGNQPDSSDELDARIKAAERKRTAMVLAAAEVGPEAVADAVKQVEAELADLRERVGRLSQVRARRAERDARLALLPEYAMRAFGWSAGEWRHFIGRFGIRVTITKFVDPSSLRSPFGDPWPYPWLVRIDGLLPGDLESGEPWRP